MPGLNYISLINRFWAVNLEHDFTGNETKLYFFLLHVCNSLGWKNPFKHSLRQIHASTGLSINSIKSVQKRLVEAGLIEIKNGVAGDRFNYENKTEYTILSVSKNDTDIDTPVSENYTDTDTPVSKIDTDNAIPVSAPVSKIDTINKLNETKENNYNISPELSTSDAHSIKIDDKPQIKVKPIIREIAVELNNWAKPYFDEKYVNDKSLDTFDKLTRIDKYSPDDIKKAIVWARKDSFWTAQFLSPVKLRTENKEGVKFIDVFLAQVLKSQAQFFKGNTKQGCTWDELAHVIATEFGGSAQSNNPTKGKYNPNDESIYCGVER